MAQRLPVALLVLLGAAGAASCGSETQSNTGNASGAGAPGLHGGVGGSGERAGSGGSVVSECPPGISCGAYCLPGETCGTNQCPVGQICMRTVYPDEHWTWDCAPNNCEAQVLDCSCVGTVCEQRALSGDWECTGADAPTITCECVDGW